MKQVQQQIAERLKQLVCPPEGIPATGGKQKSKGNEYPNASVIDLHKHVRGTATYAIDVIYKDGAGNDMARWGVIDIDENGEEGLSKARDISEYLAQNGIGSLLGFSGNKGFHVYIHTEPVPGEVMIKTLKKAKENSPFTGELIPGDGRRCKPAPCLHQAAGNMSYLFKDKPYEANFNLKNLPDGFYEQQLAILEEVTPTSANIAIVFATTDQKQEAHGDIEDMIPLFSECKGYIPPCINKLINKGGAESLGTYDKNNLTVKSFCNSMGLDSKQSLGFAKTMAKNAENGPVKTTKTEKERIQHFKSIGTTQVFNCTYLLKAKKELQFDCTDCAIRPKGVTVGQKSAAGKSKTLLLELPITNDLLAWLIQKGGDYANIAPEILPPVPYDSAVHKMKNNHCYVYSLLLKALRDGVASEVSLAGWIDSNLSKREQFSLFFNIGFLDAYEGKPIDIFIELKNKALLKFRNLKSAKLVDEDAFQEIMERAIERSMRYRIGTRSAALNFQVLDLSTDIHTSSADCTHDIGKILMASQQGAVESVEAKAESLLEYILGKGAGRVPTPFPMLNDLTGGGFANGTKTALVSPPGGGKSTVSAQFADYAASLGIPTIFVSMEMSLEQIFVNSLARAGSINSSKIMSPYSAVKDAVMDQVADLAEVYFETAGKYLYIVEGGYNTTPARIATMVSKIRADLKMSRKDPFFVVIDYLQLLYTGIEAMDTGPNETQKISELAVRVKQLARDSNVAILALSDVTKEEQKNSNESKELTLNSLRGSNRIAHAADIVIALYSESAQSDGGKAKTDPWDVYVSKMKSSENATEIIESIQNAKQDSPIGGDGATVYARMELIKNRAGQGRGSQFLLYHRAYHKLDPVTLAGQEKAEGRA
jgi:replicative DNA helicase